MAEPEVIWDVDAELGEGPCWIARDKAVWFVDIKGRRLYRYGVEDQSKWNVERPGTLALGLVVPDPYSSAKGMRSVILLSQPNANHPHLNQPSILSQENARHRTSGVKHVTAAFKRLGRAHLSRSAE